MKHRRKYIALVMALVFAIAAQIPVAASTAVEPQAAYVTIQPLWQNVNRANAVLTHTGTTAHCYVSITGLAGTTSIRATMQLSRVIGNSVSTVATWTQTVNGSRLVMNESARVTANGDYRLSVTATIVRNGVSENISFMG
ncbi:MAG: hypothetical protein FWB96_02010 [Defluviitaleaceae bacterium]|nr:hypothetical protein [Defluviitaleaceae bacterium]MCL2262015.1 hypothetical protein [Defluviitaleaceae bacterium]